jgi:hypothetical protein
MLNNKNADKTQILPRQTKKGMANMLSKVSHKLWLQPISNDVTK